MTSAPSAAFRLAVEVEFDRSRSFVQLPDQLLTCMISGSNSSIKTTRTRRAVAS
jgi:hypothetical protein